VVNVAANVTEIKINHIISILKAVHSLLTLTIMLKYYPNTCIAKPLFFMGSSNRGVSAIEAS
jgi:hypothetical protein